MCIICIRLVYTLPGLCRFIFKNSFILKKARSRGYPSKTLTDTNYSENLAVLANTPAQAESLLHSLKQSAGSIGLYVNTNKTITCFKQGVISTQRGKPLELVD